MKGSDYQSEPRLMIQLQSLKGAQLEILKERIAEAHAMLTEAVTRHQGELNMEIAKASLRLVEDAKRDGGDKHSILLGKLARCFKGRW